MGRWSWFAFSRKSRKRGKQRQGWRDRKPLESRRRLGFEPLEDRTVPSGFNANEAVDSTLTPTQLAQSLVGAGVTVSNVTFTGGAASTGNFSFKDPTVVGFDQGIILSSGTAADVVGPNLSDWNSTDFNLPGDTALDNLSGYTTHDAAVLEFDFVPTANQVVFDYAFASDEYPEWVNTQYNDVFAFFVNGTNYAQVRQVAGDPAAPFVPVAVNNINNGNPIDPTATPMRPDLFRANYVDPNGGPSAIDLEMDGITSVLTFQAPVNPGVVNHMKLAIADASDGIYDSAVFIKAGSMVSNENPVADLSVMPSVGSAPLAVTAVVEGEDPNGLSLTYTIDWGDGTPATDPVSLDQTALVNHTYASAGTYIMTLTVSNGTLSGTSSEDVDVLAANAAPTVTGNPTDQTVLEGDLFTFSASASGTPAPTVQWQISTDSGVTFTDIAGATTTTYSATASLADSGNLYQAVFTNSEGSATTTAALLTVTPLDSTPPAAPDVTLSNDTGISPTDLITQDGTLILNGIETGAAVEYSVDNGVTWSGSFSAAEGLNAILVRQTDAAGNVGNATAFSFTLDTTAPTLNPTFSSTQPFLVGAKGITFSANAWDAWGIASQSGGLVDTSTAGRKFLAIAATDLAGNMASANVPYIVGYRAINVSPLAGTTFKRTATIPVSFQLADANGLISDQVAAGLAPNITVALDGLPAVGVKYNKKTHSFSASLKTTRTMSGAYNLFIHVQVGGVDVTTVIIPINVA